MIFIYLYKRYPENREFITNTTCENMQMSQNLLYQREKSSVPPFDTKKWPQFSVSYKKEPTILNKQYKETIEARRQSHPHMIFV